MNELTIYNNHNLPATVEDLNKFILVGREKLTSVKAEIRAIKKLDMAQEVYLQKEEETRMLAEALLDAETRVGELLREIPKASGGDRTQIIHNCNFPENAGMTGKNGDGSKKDSGVVFANEHNTFTNVGGGETNISDSVKPKQQVIKDLGFTLKQANRFETLANNKDLVELVKTEAKESGELPTRTRVLELAAERKREKAPVAATWAETANEHIDKITAVGRTMINTLGGLSALNTSDEILTLWYESISMRETTLTRKRCKAVCI